MVCNGVLTLPLGKVPPPLVLKFFNPLPVLKVFTAPSPLRLEMTTSAFFIHGYFQQAYVLISEAIITD